MPAAWVWNADFGGWLANLGPYLGSDWPTSAPPLIGIFPTAANEIDYLLLPAGFDIAADDPYGAAVSSDAYTYRSGSTFGDGSYTDGSSTLPAGMDFYVGWYALGYASSPDPTGTAESLALAEYVATGTLPPYTTSDWIDAPPQMHEWNVENTSSSVNPRNEAIASAPGDDAGTGAVDHWPDVIAQAEGSGVGTRARSNLSQPAFIELFRRGELGPAYEQGELHVWDIVEQPFNIADITSQLQYPANYTPPEGIWPTGAIAVELEGDGPSTLSAETQFLIDVNDITRQSPDTWLEGGTPSLDPPIFHQIAATVQVRLVEFQQAVPGADGLHYTKDMLIGGSTLLWEQSIASSATDVELDSGFVDLPVDYVLAHPTARIYIVFGEQVSGVSPLPDPATFGPPEPAVADTSDTRVGPNTYWYTSARFRPYLVGSTWTWAIPTRVHWTAPRYRYVFAQHAATTVRTLRRRQQAAPVGSAPRRRQIANHAGSPRRGPGATP